MTSLIRVVPYNPLWPQIYEKEAKLIEQALGEKCLAIHHVGSTSVPGLAAKPVIDIIAVVKKNLDIQPEFESIGYVSKGEFHILFRQYFSKTDENVDFHLHVYEEGHAQIELNLVFRDYLVAHKDAREEYASLKHELIKDPKNHEKRGRLFTGYNLGKDTFIKGILDKAGFKGVSVHLCAHNTELESARTLRQRYFFDKVGIVDPYLWTFDHKEHAHLVLYQGTEIVGYAHLQFWPEQRVAMRIIVIDEPYRGQGLGSQFLTLCELWLKRQDIQTLHTESSPAAHAFYLKNGYSGMSFNDPDDQAVNQIDIPMGKKL